MNRRCVYKIECVPTGDIYVGGTNNFLRRKAHHLFCLRHGRFQNEKLQRVWVAYGEASFLFTVLEDVAEGRDLYAAEQQWIDRLIPSLNVHPTAGSSKGFRRAFTPDHRARLAASATGRRLSGEAKAKMSAAKKGTTRVFTEQHKANIKAAWVARRAKHG